MPTKKLPTVDIKGKEYIMVKDRILAFNDMYKNGAIYTELVSEPQDDHIVIKATVIPDCDKPQRFFSDYAQETVGKGMINVTSALENASTSAVGRALAYLGIGIIDSIASADEVNKAQRPVPGGNLDESPPVLVGGITEKQIATLKGTMVSRGIKTAADAKLAFKLWAGREVAHANELTKQEASDMIGKLKELDMEMVLATLIAEKANQMGEEPF